MGPPVQAQLNEIEKVPDATRRVDAYRRLIDQFPLNAALWFNLSSDLVHLDRTDEAYQALVHAVEYDPAIRDHLNEAQRALIAHPASAHQPTLKSPTVPEPTDPRVGLEVGRYRILRAAHQDPLQVLYDGVASDGTPVTVRALPELGPHGAARFFESQLTAAVGRPGCAHMVDLVHDPDGTPLQILRRLRGPTVAELAAILPLRRRMELGLHIARRLEEALRTPGDLRCDLRPSQIVCDESDTDSPIVTLLGLSEPALVSTLPLSEPRLRWMAPEVGGARAAEERAHVYELGLLLRYLATLRLPPSLTDRIRSPEPDLPEDLADLPEGPVIRRCLALRTDDRYATVAELAQALTQASNTGAASAPRPRSDPKVLVNWRLLRLLGEGTFGAVWEAEDVRTPERRAAVKVLHGDASSDARVRQMLFEEVRAASLPSHENIIRILDFGTSEAGSSYIAMELLVGESLGTLLARTPERRLPLDETRDIGLQVARALRAAHACGVVHRDLKPDNLFLIPTDAQPRFVKVLDFGVAKLRGRPALGGRTLSEGQLIGTAEYMAPEQWVASPEIDGRADIYALGVILYLCVTGRLPYHGETLFEWGQAHREAPVPEPEASRAMPGPLAALIRRMLAKLPEERPKDMEEVAAALTSLSLPPGATQAGIEPKGSRPPWRRVAVAAALAAALAVGGTLAWRSHRRSELHRLTGAVEADLTDRRWPDALRDADEALRLSPGDAHLVELRAQALRSQASQTYYERFVAAKTSNDCKMMHELFAAHERDDVYGPALVRAYWAALPGCVAPLENPWIEVRPPSQPPRLGVPDSTPSDEPGLRPDRNLRAPTRRFALQQHEVTWAELHAWLPGAVAKPPGWADEPDRTKLPATGVPWNIANDYCRDQEASLPTEEQWELAARGSELRPYPWGTGPIELHANRLDHTHAWQGPQAKPAVVTTSLQDQTASDRRAALFDLAGNAREWTASLYLPDRPGGDEAWLTQEKREYRTVRGLPLDQKPPHRLPTVGAAWRSALCSAGKCPSDLSAALRGVGFRCAKWLD